MRRSRLVLAFLAPYVAGLGVLAGVAATSRSDRAFTLGVVPGTFVKLQPGEAACESGIDVPEAFDRVQPLVGTFGRPGPALRADVRGADGRRLGSGARAGGYADASRVSIPVGHVAGGQRVTVCVRSPAGRVALYGNAGKSAPEAGLAVGGRPVDLDLDLRFGGSAESRLHEIAEMLRHASVFKAAGVGTWTYWLLLAAVLAGAPALALAALLSLRPDPRD